MFLGLCSRKCYELDRIDCSSLYNEETCGQNDKQGCSWNGQACYQNVTILGNTRSTAGTNTDSTVDTNTDSTLSYQKEKEARKEKVYQAEGGVL